MAQQYTITGFVIDEDTYDFKDTTTGNATTTEPGFMSAADKISLDDLVLATANMYTKTETDAAIAQSTATLNLNFSVNDDTWGEIYTILSEVSTLKSAFFLTQGPATNVLTNGKLNIAVKGMVNRAADGVYDFIAYTGYQPQYIWIWRITGFTSGSVTPTVSAVYRFTGTAI